MLVKFLGTIDFISGLILIFGAGIKLPSFLLIIIGVILLIKASMGMLKDFASWIDFIAGLIFIASMFFIVPSIICIVLGILILQKGLFSFL
ncbi:Uncharacterised protein [uncultured archaeon]|nr:Uncharacterised protein [uncultured archaeon]